MTCNTPQACKCAAELPQHLTMTSATTTAQPDTAPAQPDTPIRVGVVLFDGFEPLDVCGPVSVLASVPGSRRFQMVYLAPQAGPVTSETGGSDVAQYNHHSLSLGGALFAHPLPLAHTPHTPQPPPPSLDDLAGQPLVYRHAAARGTRSVVSLDLGPKAWPVRLCVCGVQKAQTPD
jgi:hypothetical protein